MKDFIATIPEKIVFGAGKINQLSEHINGMGKKAIIVTGKSVRPEKTLLIEKIQKQLADVNIESVVFAEVEENPSTVTCDKAAALAVEQDCDLVVGVGGGSSMDAAKIVALLVADGGQAVDYIPGGKFADKPDSEMYCLPIVLITTTSGTGSETTPFAVVTNPENNQKPGTGHDFWYADLSIVDPELSVTLPKNPTINTGLDVFFHAYEALVCKSENEFADLFAIRAIELVVENLEKVVNDPKDIDARSAMALANSLAGTAISLSGTFAIHGMGHTISGHYDAKHGASLCALGPELTRFSYKGNIKKFAKAAELLGGDMKKSDEELAQECADLMTKFLAKFNMDIGIASLGVKEEDIDQLVEDSFFAMSGAMGETPISITKDDAKQIFLNAM